jgi:hypothetical protein
MSNRDALGCLFNDGTAYVGQRPDSFPTLLLKTYRSMMVMIGQMRAPATAALAASAPNRSPKLRVFHPWPVFKGFFNGVSLTATGTAENFEVGTGMTDVASRDMME